MEECSNIVETKDSPENAEAVPIEPTITDHIENDKGKSPIESEYDSAGSYSDEEGKVKAEGSDSGSHSCEESVALERQEGDGQESSSLKKVDDDEDKKNPQYIPKKGSFYEHDDRTAEEEEMAKEAEAEKEKDSKKKLWDDKKEKWSHDKFNDNDQAPKSKTELVSIYGYDIRNEDGPPRARRRRRYGRGPNKYTRNWEDEDAYNKAFVQKPKKKPFSKDDNEEFPALNQNTERKLKSNKNNSSYREQTENLNFAEKDVTKPEERVSFIQEKQSKEILAESQPVVDTNEHKNNIQKSAKNTKTIPVSEYNGFTSKGRNYKTPRIGMKNQKKEDYKEYIHSRNFSSKNANSSSVDQAETEAALKKLTIQDTNRGKQNSQRQGSVPPRLQNEPKGPKRYSSMRQRSLPEMVNSPIMQQGYYPNAEFNQEQQSSNQVLQNSSIPTNITQIPPNMSPLAQQVPVTATPILGAAPQFPPPPFPQGAPPYLPGPVPGPAAFIQQPAPPLLNYVQPPTQFPPQGFQGYQAPTFNPVQTQPTELYQPQGGITYYSTDQQVAQRPAPQKRPKAAIPIVAPPNYDIKNKSPSIEESQVENSLVECNYGE